MKYASPSLHSRELVASIKTNAGDDYNVMLIATVYIGDDCLNDKEHGVESREILDAYDGIVYKILKETFVRMYFM